MKKAYLLVFSDTMGDHSSFKSWANSSSLVDTWRYDLPHCFYLVSEASASELDEDLKDFFGIEGHYLITEISENRQGRLPKDTWYFFRFKRVKSKKSFM